MALSAAYIVVAAFMEAMRLHKEEGWRLLAGAFCAYIGHVMFW